MLFKRLAFKKFFSSIRKNKNAGASAILPLKTAMAEGEPKPGDQRRGPFMCPHRPAHGETVSPIFASSIPKMCIPCQQTLAKNKQNQESSLTVYFREKIEPTIHTYRQASGVRCSCCKRIPTHSSKVYYGHVYCEPCLYKLILNQQLENPLHYCNVSVDNSENGESKVFIENEKNLVPRDCEPEVKSAWEECGCDIPKTYYARSSSFSGASGGVLPPAPPQPASTRNREPAKYMWSKSY